MIYDVLAKIILTRQLVYGGSSMLSFLNICILLIKIGFCVGKKYCHQK